MLGLAALTAFVVVSDPPASSFVTALEDGGFEQIEVRPTHQVHEHASSAIIRARKPLA